MFKIRKDDKKLTRLVVNVVIEVRTGHYEKSEHAQDVPEKREQNM